MSEFYQVQPVTNLLCTIAGSPLRGLAIEGLSIIVKNNEGHQTKHASRPSSSGLNNIQSMRLIIVLHTLIHYIFQTVRAFL